MMDRDPFKEYIKQSEPDKRTKGYAWHTAIGLQAVDGLKPSEFLIDTAIRNIEGDISIDEAQELLNSYYRQSPESDSEDRTEEADKVSARIAKILSEKAFSFTPNEYISIHKKLFTGIYSHAGKIRDYNITKNEWVLNGGTVLYGSASELRATLDYDFAVEKSFSYKNLSMDEIIHHLAVFVSRLWQIHIFGEGNTRTTAVFFIKYLRTLGFDVTNDIFAENAWYFRNALVRANYNDLKNGIHETTEFLELFLRNLLLGENNELHNRTMHISGKFTPKPDIENEKPDIERAKPDIENGKADIESEKPDIENVKRDIQNAKADIEARLAEVSEKISQKTINYAFDLFSKYGTENYFGRSQVEEITGLKSSRASDLIKLLLKSGIIEPVEGHGKGKYRFCDM
jgi:fido (protein-threonine AMPylation protein)